MIDDTPRSHGVNVPLLRKTLEHVTAHPEEHDQLNWGRRTACGTQYCLAGWAVVLDGREIRWEAPDSAWPNSAWDDQVAYNLIGGQVAYNLIDGQGIGRVAAELLGVSIGGWAPPPGHLFHEGNTLADLWHIANELTDGEIEVPEQFREAS